MSAAEGTGPVDGEDVDDREAAELLEVEPGRIDAMVEEGLLSPVAASPRRFRRSEVMALRNLGG